jgi:hypothetical protein
MLEDIEVAAAVVVLGAKTESNKSMQKQKWHAHSDFGKKTSSNRRFKQESHFASSSNRDAKKPH